ncbi:MAG: DNA-binding transcriptional regulator [Sedimentisphaerales bacterium]|nr:DNA-binding transcriptional regulator [Sedimentisphaerales bacterium]
MIETSRGFGRALLRGIARYAQQHGPWNFYHTPAFYLHSQDPFSSHELARLKKWGATGIIMREIPNHNDILALKLPTIVSTYAHEHVPADGEIYVDNYGMGVMAADYLLKRGFCRFAFCGFDEFFWSQQRYAGFRNCVQKAGFEVNFYHRPSDPEARRWDKEQTILIQWLQTLPKPIGLMACIDERSEHVVEACRNADIRIPEDIALISGDNDELICELANPSISSVAINGVNAGYHAAALLDKLMHGQNIQNRKITVSPTHVVTRHSTDILAIEDKEVSLALQYIQRNANNPIQVDEIAQAVCLSRRTLERRFQSVLHRSVLYEINRVRMDRFARMLIDTDLSITQLALVLGHPHLANVSRLFQRYMHVSPQEYRRKFGWD